MLAQYTVLEASTKVNGMG